MNKDEKSDTITRLILPVGRSRWAIMAGYLGLLSFIPGVGIIAIAAGVLAVRDIKRNPEKHGMGRAITGIVLGVLLSLFWVIMLLND